MNNLQFLKVVAGVVIGYAQNGWPIWLDSYRGSMVWIEMWPLYLDIGTLQDFLKLSLSFL